MPTPPIATLTALLERGRDLDARVRAQLDSDTPPTYREALALELQCVEFVEDLEALSARLPDAPTTPGELLADGLESECARFDWVRTYTELM